MICSPADTVVHHQHHHTYLFIGQDLASIQNYRIQFPSYNNSGYMVYTNLRHLRGLDTPTDYGSGIEYADGLLSLSSSSSVQNNPTENNDGDNATDENAALLQIGLWLHGSTGCNDILQGKLNHQIQQLFDYLMVHCRAHKVFLRLGYEFDNPDFGYVKDPFAYRQAFRTLVQYCRDRYPTQCSEKIDFVWHSWAASINNMDVLEQYYPGDDVVDWIAISIFSQVYRDPNRQLLGNLNTIQQVLDFATNHEKPIMIAESTPFGGIDSLEDPWAEWFQPVLDLIETYDIGAWSYIDCDWDSQPMWKGVGFGDTRLSINSTVQQLWKQQVLQSPRFRAPLLLRHHNNDSQPNQQQELGYLAVENSLVPNNISLFHFSKSTVLVVFLVCCFVRSKYYGGKRKHYEQIKDETSCTEQVIRACPCEM